ncbi:TPA: hypothetical protein ACX6Q6_003548 [Photobacterium damselae]
MESVRPLGLSLSEQEILELLDKSFPLLNPSENESITSIQRKAGQRDVVDYLRYYLSEGKTNLQQ